MHTKMRISPSTIRFCFLIFLISTTVFAQKNSADLIVTNGRIWTANAGQPYVSSIAIRGDRIVAAGDALVTAKYRGTKTKIVDLGGRFAMPGINDSHIHFLSGSLGAFQVDLTDAKSLSDAQKMIRKFADENPDAKWITGFGWQYTIFPNGGLPTREGIDAVVNDRPVFIRAYDGHTGWANSKALEIAGVDEKTEFTGFGEIVRDNLKRPTGALKESAMGLVSSHLPPVSRATQLEALRRGMTNAASLGITSIQNASGNAAEAELYDELLKNGELSLRVSLAFGINAGATQSTIDGVSAAAKKFSSPMLRVGAVKILVDGVIESHTAAMLAPYSNKPETSGTPTFTQERLNNVVAMADKAGLQVYIHAIGDRGVRMALDAFENAIKVNGRPDSRFRIEHIETIDPADVPRFKQLGVIASMEPIHADPATIGVWSAAIGPVRSSRGFAWRTLENAGAKLIFSSDYPASISMSPWRGLHSAVNRQTKDGVPVGGWYPQNRVSVLSALTAYTAGGAYASFEEKTKGRISAGMFADIIVLDRDPFKTRASDLHKISVMKTIFGGRVVYEIPKK